MRILLATERHLPVIGGAYVTVHWLARALAVRGHRVTVLSVAAPGAGRSGAEANSRFDRSLGYPVVRLAGPSAVTPALLDGLAPDAAIMNVFHERLVEWGASLAHALGEVPTAMYFHDARGIELAGNGEHVAAVSRFLAELCGPGTPVIPPIVEHSGYRVPTTRESVLFVNPVPEKGLATAVALARARPDIPFVFQRAWPLPPAALASLDRQVRDLANVEVREPAQDARAIYGDARILLAPSVKDEAWGRVARESQASGIPVVAAGVGGLPEAVGAGGIVVRPEEGIDGWLAALGRLWDEPETYAAAVERAQLQGADPATTSDAVGAAFEGLLERARAHGSPPAYLVGLRYPHHARHSGYEQLGRHTGHWIQGPLRARWLPGRAGRALDRGLSEALGRPRYSLGVLMSELAAAAHMLRRRGSVYHVMYGDRDLMLLRILAGRNGNRLIATFHGPLATPAASLEKLAGKLDGAILVADYQRVHFESLFPPDRIFVVRYGVDSSFFRPAIGPAEGRTCITVGSHQRDFATLTSAVRHVWREDPSVRFVFAGLESERVLGPLATDNRVRVLGRISDAELRAAYQSASLALFAFHDATASNSLLEAMACGLPVVATDVGGVAEYVDRSAAWLGPPRDSGSAAEGVLTLLADPERARRMGRASRALAVARDFRVMAAEVEKVYASVLAR